MTRLCTALCHHNLSLISRSLFRFAGTLLILCVVVVSTLKSSFAESDATFRDAKTQFSKQIRKKAPADRIAAVEAIAEFAQFEAADLVLKKGILDPALEVRLASQTALRNIARNPQIARALLEDLKKHLKRPMPIETIPEYFRALATTTDKQIQEGLVKALDEYLASPKGNLLTPIQIIDDFSKQGDLDALNAVLLFTKSKSFDSNFGYRRCVIQALFRMKHPQAVTFLIELLPQAQGLIHHDIVVYLSKLTEQKFRDDHQDWTEWWNTHRDTFEFPLILPLVNHEPLDDKRPTYYGIPICAKRIVFVLDTSGSMRGRPIEAAKKALLDVIATLPESVHFDVVLFDKSISEWQPTLVPATSENRQLASQTVMAKSLQNGTASFAALYAAFDLEPEAIYFLSDGRPTDGSPDQIAQTILVKNRTRRISIHTIGVVTDRSNGSGLTYFMKPLAEENYGSFKLIQ